MKAGGLRTPTRPAGDRPVRQASLREHNLALVLRHVGAAPRPPSRADIAAATGLTRATVSALVDDLIGGRLLTEVDPAPRSGAGRPAVGLVLGANGPAGLGLEINVDYLAACVVDLAGTVRHRVAHRADQRPHSAAEVLTRLADLAGAARAAADADGLILAGAALAVPGLVTADGLVRLAPNLGWRDVDAPGLLSGHPALADLPLTVDNEANLAALGELHAATADAPNFLYISGEIGIGAGIVLHGTLFRGARGWSGELGHVPVRPDGPACRCGSHGCLEQYAGQEAILRAAGLAGYGLAPDAAIVRLTELATARDRDTVEALAGAATALGVAVAGVVNLLDVDTVVLGGVYAPLAPWLRPTVEAELARRVLTASWSPVAVRPSVLGGDAAAVGAAGSVVRAVRDHPARWLAGAPDSSGGGR
ncbi:Sugar kinase of the NBD/HSP70 family, may contain an N-terminal HTH domain [Micromonospora pattaloongensis]|uniref:Sugar kinase of the NBD/HSP70 family, may contain an N-terminal HTH domain n=1 Tax=Micromonospora pattaloongensis TaxID=405436 RepID=A0A1H3FL44_9ACTN|nr:ROK family transcriptional regulator [Micromonospora pattaloongensis]SDX91833.1 Sugar kinase of the NBD/HSP70 family, may contain an N-terminal HTH domain [Micromonospora pattaloongensis]